jgi:hypothetical protein
MTRLFVLEMAGKKFVQWAIRQEDEDTIGDGLMELPKGKPFQGVPWDQLTTSRTNKATCVAQAARVAGWALPRLHLPPIVPRPNAPPMASVGLPLPTGLHVSLDVGHTRPTGAFR